MTTSIATPRQRERILWGAALYGFFFGLMPPYVLTIVVLATWGMPPLEPPDEQTFRSVYYLRLVLANVVGLSVGAGLSIGATALGLRIAGRPTYPRAILGGIGLGAPTGALTAGATPLFLLISSSDREWALEMIRRSIACGALFGAINGLTAALAIVFYLRRGD